MRRPLLLGLVIAVSGALLAGPAGSVPQRAVPSLRVTTVVEGLDHPWDIAPIGGGEYLLTQRDRATVSLLDADGTLRRLAFPSRRVWVSGETGLLGLVADPGFERNRRFYTCQGATRSSGGHDVRVMAWKLNQRATRAKRRGPLLTGLPATTGRHGGCRLLVADNGALLVGTGDAATGTNPRDLTSLGGKTLRLDRRTGEPWPGNRFSGATNARKRYVFTYGHRNVQGLAQRRDGSLWSVEHGSFRDDEVNRLVRGGDYGWHPVPGYDEQVPMTDRSLPGRQHRARWRSGNPTVAPGGATFVSGKQWGALRGDLAVAVLKDQQVLFLDFDSRGRLDGRRTPQALQQHGRIRTVVQDTDGSLLLLTDNGSGTDRVLRVRPR
ncbi:Soluble aldose sugar dehydrogenase YliI precursor [Nocardioides dokdonensis FR1436]|uniref:Soluble aldose sugar dehydrogenase YliI n=1 Tax=Nocardioides dokdonensis FR1436 TaxID=1300347 RepID=A0A1A9GM94_9ACTN|nr:PQQ-dependent sugar dehydrogenase [Nocardioides dokdonensis]ANH39196.1 Soluble aldose sugar dehydrogenase YliI precursor [Nocardioides dokdonensis FR1436]